MQIAKNLQQSAQTSVLPNKATKKPKTSPKPKASNKPTLLHRQKLQQAAQQAAYSAGKLSTNNSLASSGDISVLAYSDKALPPQPPDIDASTGRS